MRDDCGGRGCGREFELQAAYASSLARSRDHNTSRLLRWQVPLDFLTGDHVSTSPLIICAVLLKIIIATHMQLSPPNGQAIHIRVLDALNPLNIVGKSVQTLLSRQDYLTVIYIVGRFSMLLIDAKCSAGRDSHSNYLW